MGVESGNKYIMRGCGLVTPDGTRGDLVVHIKQKMPSKLTDNEIEKLKELRESINFKR
jgi:DnaJ-class molecular chaperone